MSATWEYIRKRRGWTSQIIVDSLSDKSWENFCLFFTTRNIEIPDRSEYDACFPPETKVPSVPLDTKSKKTPRKRTTKSKGKTSAK
jgi:hypothetical protein